MGVSGNNTTYILEVKKMKQISTLLLAIILTFGFVGSMTYADNGMNNGNGNNNNNVAAGADDNDDDTDWGWIGLIGLAGLLGLRGRDKGNNR
jgi:MYXO-CTERM domain-containing protein